MNTDRHRKAFFAYSIRHNQPALPSTLRDEISSILDQIGIDTKHSRDSRFDLRVTVVLTTKQPRRLGNQLRDRLTLFHSRLTNYHDPHMLTRNRT